MIPDHLNLPVNDLAASARFYQDPAGWISEGQDEPFTIMRVAPDFMVQLAPWGTTVGVHLACAMSRAEFDPAFQRFRDHGIPHGDSFATVESMAGPGMEGGREESLQRSTSLTPTSTCSS